MTVYISDLDGTLLHPEGRLTARARQSVQGLLDAGVPFTVATARSVISMRAVLGDLPLRLPVIAYNGGMISDLATGENLHVFPLAQDVAAEIYARGVAAGFAPTVSTTTPAGDRVYLRAPLANAGVEMYTAERQQAKDPRLRIIPDPRRGLDETVTCLTLIAQRERLEPFQQMLLADFGEQVQPHLFDDLYTVGWTWITIHSQQARKERAIETVLEMQGWSGRRWVAFGDQDNDVGMIRSADRGVAVANAIPAVKAVADEIIGPNREDSVARYLEGVLKQ